MPENQLTEGNPKGGRLCTSYLRVTPDPASRRDAKGGIHRAKPYTCRGAVVHVKEERARLLVRVAYSNPSG